jgi:hypothetical protein
VQAQYIPLIILWNNNSVSANPEYMATVDEDGGLIIFNTKDCSLHFLWLLLTTRIY